MNRQYLDFPLDKGVGIWVAVDAEEEEPLALFVVAVVGVKNLFPWKFPEKQIKQWRNRILEHKTEENEWNMSSGEEDGEKK